MRYTCNTQVHTAEVFQHGWITLMSLLSSLAASRFSLSSLHCSPLYTAAVASVPGGDTTTLSPMRPLRHRRQCYSNLRTAFAFSGEGQSTPPLRAPCPPFCSSVHHAQG